MFQVSLQYPATSRAKFADILKAAYKYTADTGDLLLRNKMVFLKIGTYMYFSIALTNTCSFQNTKRPRVNSEKNAKTVPSLNHGSLRTTSFLRSHKVYSGKQKCESLELITKLGTSC